MTGIQNGVKMAEVLSADEAKALLCIKICYQEHRITKQQYRTLRGQVFAGFGCDALRGLEKILRKGGAYGV